MEYTAQIDSTVKEGRGKEKADAYFMPMRPLPKSQGNFGRKSKEN